MEWDEEVDVVCTGAGVAGLAGAIAAVDAGGEVFVASPDGVDDRTPIPVTVRSRIDSRHPWLGDVSDAETVEFFAALSSDVGPLSGLTSDVDVPIRSVHEPVPVGPRTTIPPFYGARLRDWTTRCLTSPSGYLYTRIADWRSTMYLTDDGDTIEVGEIGSMTPELDNVGGSVFDWLVAEADERWIEVQPNCSLQRIVFEEGEVVGAVFTTPDGPLAIRARHGVQVAAESTRVDTAEQQKLVGVGGQLRVCLVARTGSRFGRVELLTSEPVGQAGLTCRPVTRALHTNLHESHGQLQAWRCGKVDGNPPPGQ